MIFIVSLVDKFFSVISIHWTLLFSMECEKPGTKIQKIIQYTKLYFLKVISPLN